ncbi:heat-inducible transcription repressor HrcA, partial [bacterium]|nr:heat-inducible transcription repressor HrcA [bacterium]
MVDLSERESEILESLIKCFTANANPVGSRFLSKKMSTKLSPATIRNVMFDLEEKGLINQPHTSAGRVPTDMGYRVYVNSLMHQRYLTAPEKRAIEARFEFLNPNQNLIMARTSQVLSEISRQLGVVLAPRFEEGVFRRLELVRLSVTRLLVVISIESGLARTVSIELKSVTLEDEIEDTVRKLNERLSGLTLSEIRRSIGKRLDDLTHTDVGLINFFVDSVASLFTMDLTEEVHVDGMHQVVNLPEFSDMARTRQMLDLVENQKQLIMHVLNDSGQADAVSILIGNENDDRLLKELSLVSATYQVGGIAGVLGIIGPTRMQYAKMVALVDYVS